MSVCKPETKEKLFRRQNGLSPITGMPLDRKKRLEAHHKEEKYNGGGNNQDNLQLLPIYEHLLVHFMRSRDSGLSEEERKREIDIVFGRFGELKEEEKKNFYFYMEKIVGIKVRFM